MAYEITDGHHTGPAKANPIAEQINKDFPLLLSTRNIVPRYKPMHAGPKATLSLSHEPPQL